MFKAIITAGKDFAHNRFSGWSQKLFGEDKPEDEAIGLSGALAIGTGGLIRSVGYVALGITAIAALSNPVTLAAAAGYATVGILSAGGIAFGKGMEKGGDEMSGLLTFQRELRHGIKETAREEFRAWREKKLGGRFAKAGVKAAPVPVETAPAAQADTAPKP